MKHTLLLSLLLVSALCAGAMQNDNMNTILKVSETNMRFYLLLLPLVLISFPDGNVVKKVNIPELHLKAEVALDKTLFKTSS